MVWTGTATFQLNAPSVVGVGARGVPGEVGLKILRNVPGGDRVDLECAAPRSGPLRIDVLDVLGRRVSKIYDGVVGAGRHVVSWDLRRTDGLHPAAGIYFVRASTPDGVAAGRVVLVR